MNIVGKCSPDGRYICQNGGTCSFDGNKETICICPPGVVGMFCETSNMIII